MSFKVEEENKTLALQLIEEVLNRRNVAAAAQFLAPDVIRHSLGSLFPSAGSAGGVRNFLGVMRAAIPDLQVEVQQAVAEGDRVVVHFTMSGTHTGDLFGLLGTGSRVVVPCINIYRFAAGKIVETWQMSDELSLLVQIGAYSPLRATAAG